MLAAFCLRLALGMLGSLVLLAPRTMHPRFFRTHLATVLGLGVVALVMGWGTAGDALGRRVALSVAMVAPLLGAIVWILERPPFGWTLIGIGAVAQVAGLSILASEHVAAHPFRAADGAAMATLGLVAGDLASAALLGFAMTGMLVGHSYLIQPGLSIRPLMGQLAGLGAALLARTAVAAVALWLWTGDHDIMNLGDETVLWLPVRWGVGLLGPAVFGWMAFRTAQIRSTQSATGILYVVVILVFLGELTGLLLARNTGLPL